MKKSLVLFFSLILLLPLTAQVDREELESINYSGVEFRNYEGPHSKIDSIQDIIGIGSAMARRDAQGIGRYFDRYRIIHIFDPQEERLLNGDIFIIEAGAGVDHIDNVRRIISGYLMDAYGYSSADALVLARFVTYYNAVFRGNINYFKENYVPRLASYLEPAKVGISTRYEEWPGQTQMIIPLSHRPGQEGPALSTDTLTSPEVVENLREQEDKGLDDRKAMTDIKETEIQEEEKAIQETKRDIQEREEEISQERQDIAQQEKELSEREETAAPGDTSVEEERTQVEQKKEELAQKEETLTQEKEELAQREERQEERLEQIREEREQIAKDEQEILAQEEGSKDDEPRGGAGPQPAVKTAPFLLLADGSDILGTLILVNIADGSQVKTSSLNTIRGGGFYSYQNNYLVIAGEESGERIISLVLLDKTSLEARDSGTVSVAGNSQILIQGNDIYAAVRRDNRWVPGRFNRDLELTGILDRSMASFSFLSIEEGNLLFQDERGRVQIVPLSEMAAP